MTRESLVEEARGKRRPALSLARDSAIISNSARCTSLSLALCCEPFLSMFATNSCSYRSPSKLFKMPPTKRRLTRSALNTSPIEAKSPRLNKFYRSTKESKELSPKHRLSSKTPSAKSPDVRKYFSPSSRTSSPARTGSPTAGPATKRVVPKRRVNLNNVFEHIVTVTEVPTYNVTISEVPESTSTGCLKRAQPQSLDQPSAKCIKTEQDSEQLMAEGASHAVSAVSYKTDVPALSDPLLPPPPCIKRRWKSLSGRPGVKLFDPNSPRTASKVQLLCKKLWFSPPTSCEIQTLS